MTGRVVLNEIPTAACVVDDLNPRTSGPGDVTDLAASIADLGILQPLIVRRRADGTFGVLCGQRRFTAALQLGLEVVPASIHDDLDDITALSIAAAENIGRGAMNAIEEAEAFARLRDDHGLTQAEVAARCGANQGDVSKKLQLLDLPDDVQDDIAAGRVSWNTAYLKFLRRERRAKAIETQDGDDRRVTTIKVPKVIGREISDWLASAMIRQDAGQLFERALRREMAEPSCWRRGCHRPSLYGGRHCDQCLAELKKLTARTHGRANGDGARIAEQFDRAGVRSA